MWEFEWMNDKGEEDKKEEEEKKELWVSMIERWKRGGGGKVWVCEWWRREGKRRGIHICENESN